MKSSTTLNAKDKTMTPINSPSDAATSDRIFNPTKHLIPLFDEYRRGNLKDEEGNVLEGITGIAGAAAITMLSNEEIGVDYIEMEPGHDFPLHTHPGDHLLVFLEGQALVHINGTDWLATAGFSIFIPGEYAHGVKTVPGFAGTLRFIAFGHPHKHIHGTDRMHVLTEAEIAAAESEKLFDKVVLEPEADSSHD